METPQHDFAQDNGGRAFLANSDLSSEDNWQGLTDAKERRKRQNRINQRNRRQARKRMQLANGQSTTPTKPSSLRSFPRTILPILPGPLAIMDRPTNFPGQVSHEPITELESHVGTSVSQSSHLPSSRDSPSYPDRPSSSSTLMTLWFRILCDRKRKVLVQQLATFYTSYAMNSPTSSHLLTLTRLNVHRAFVSNMLSLGITWEWMQEDSISPLSVVGPTRDFGSLPNSLLPTLLQRRSVHHTWIDLFPCPVMRDNLLRAGNEWDDEELCIDIMGFWDGNVGDSHGLVVWGDPSDPRNWEVQPGFVKKWGWVIRGCDEIIYSTNRWRAKRGERPLFAASFLTSFR